MSSILWVYTLLSMVLAVYTSSLMGVQNLLCKHIKGLIVKHQDNLAMDFDNLDLTDKLDRGQCTNEVLPELYDALDGKGPDGQRFVEIFEYKNIIKSDDKI
ncbi:hypothetical protein QT397_17355 [Microbulbifer sp. MKSA007]|nr:hypothetical protein QT397_17355 [Microbulbifer sp. MKSA007]